MPQPYLVLDAQLIIVAASDRYLDLTSRAREEIVGRHILEAYPENPDAVGTVEQGPLEVSLRHVLTTRKPHEMAVIQYDIPKVGGGFEQKFWTPVHTPVLGHDGSVQYIIQNPMDVTQSVVKQREADARLRVALHAADLGSWEYEPETDMWRRSPTVDELFGFKGGEGGSVAEPFFARIHSDDLASVKSAVNGALACPDQTLLRFDYRIVDPATGNIRYVASRGEVLRSSSGRVRMIGVMMDITANRQRELELSRAIAAKDQLLGQKDVLLTEINHRVKNSLQLVVSILSLQARKLDDVSARGSLERAIARVRAITSVHERLYRNDDPLVVDMSEYLTALFADLTIRFGQSDRLTVSISPMKLRTEQAIPIAVVVNELVANAIEFGNSPDMPPSVNLALKADDDGSFVLSVQDPGIGPKAASVDGLGTRLIKSMAAQIGGKFETRADQSGYLARITFPRSEM
jgi:two-component sensor histidine kinase